VARLHRLGGFGFDGGVNVSDWEIFLAMNFFSAVLMFSFMAWLLWMLSKPTSPERLEELKRERAERIRRLLED